MTLQTLRTKAIVAAMTISTAVMASPMVAFASSTGFDTISNPIIDLINDMVGPVLGIVGAIGTLYCILLGVKFAKAEEPQEREKEKQHLKNAIIGFLLIFILIFALSRAMPIMINWVNSNANNVHITQ